MGNVLTRGSRRRTIDALARTPTTRFPSMRTRLLALAALLVLLPAANAADPATFPLKDGDTWVMAGDSITAQHLHSNYFEAFCYARYPKMTFRFRNSGVGG